MVEGEAAIVSARGATCSRSEWTTVALTLIREDCEARAAGEARSRTARAAAIRLAVCMALPQCTAQASQRRGKAPRLRMVAEGRRAGGLPFTESRLGDSGIQTLAGRSEAAEGGPGDAAGRRPIPLGAGCRAS